MINLSDKVAIVTGASGTLGKSIVKKFQDMGAKVVATDIKGDEVHNVDIRTEEGNTQLIEHAMTEHGRIDILVLNAGVQHVSPIPHFALEDWEEIHNVMLTAPFLTLKTAWPHLTSRNSSRVLFTASTSSFIGERFKSAYVAAKHGVVGLMKVAALEGAEYGLTSNAVAPAWMLTPMVENQIADQASLHGLTEDEVVSRMISDHAVKRFVDPNEVAATLAYLASDSASGITGVTLPVDLGALA